MGSMKRPLETPMRLDIPHSARSISYSDHDSEYETPANTTLQEDDVQTAIGVSISRAQTRLMSPKTPAAEKAAAFEDLDGTGQFDGAADSPPPDEENIEQEGQVAKAAEVEEPVRKTLRRSHSDTSDCALRNLPSPWTASPKTFEKPCGQPRGRAPAKTRTSPTGVLADLNIKRFMSSLTFPSMPKAPNLKEFSLPSIASVFGGKEDGQTDKDVTRQKRASSVLLSKSQWSGVKRSSPSRTPLREKAEDQASNLLYGTDITHSTSAAQTAPEWNRGESESTDTSEEATPTAAVPSDTLAPRPVLMRRVTSDQSFALKRATSTGSSLGDDSRWEGVQEQVNSRLKAIKDSLQDSSLKIPGMPNLANMNLNSLRPEFLRARGSSDPKHYSSNRSNARFGQVSIANGKGDHERKLVQMNEDKLRMPKKSPKSMHPKLDRALEHLTGDLVIMGGYRGSILRSAKPPHRQLWVPVKVGLNIRKVNLEVGLNPEDEEKMHETIFASSMLSHIGPVDMGRRLLKKIRESPNCQNGRLRLHDYGWDWRLSPQLLSNRLIDFLEKLPCNAEGVPAHERGATVIAHSMGGLITRHAVNRRPELFNGVVYAGVPQHCVNILGPLRNGDEVLLSSKVLTAQVNFTLRTSFLLLPEDGKCFINKDNKEPYPVDFFNIESWKTYAFSPCIASALPPYTQAEKRGILDTVYSSLPSLPQPLRRFPPQVIHGSSIDAAKEAPAATTSSLANSSAAINDHSITSTIPLSAALTYLTRTLASTLVFKSELAANTTLTSQNRYPPLSILFSTNTPTVAAARVSSRDAIRCVDAYDNLQFGSGDGVCLAKAAQLPEGYTASEGGRVKSERGHVGLLGDLEGVGRCLSAVGRARKGGCGLGRDE